MKYIAVLWGLTLCWAQAADAPGADKKLCLINHFQNAEESKAPHYLLCWTDGNPADPEMLKQAIAALQKDPKNPDKQLSAAAAYLKHADTSQWEYLAKAKKHLKKAKSAYPKDPYVTMYLGRATGAQALNLKPSVFTRLKLAREGFRLMDAAVKSKPDCLWLRLLRGEAQLMAHPILRRKDRLKKDAEMLQKFMGTEGFLQLSPYQQAKMHLFLGCYFEKVKAREADVTAQLKLAAEKGQATEIGKEASARLKGNWQEIGYSGE